MQRSPWGEHIEGYLATRRHAGRSPSTLLGDALALQIFLYFLALEGVRDPRQIERATLEAFVDFLARTYRGRRGDRVGARLCSTTVYRRVGTAVGFTRYLAREGRLLMDPTVGFQRPRCVRTRRRFIPTVEEVKRFLEAIDSSEPMGVRERALFELLYSTGLRTGEASHLDLYDLDLAGLTLRVREGKGRRDRVVPVGREAVRWVRRYLMEVRPTWVGRQTGEAVFITRRGTRMSAFLVHLACRRWRSRAGLPWLTPHALRHAVATHMLAAGADIRLVQELLGHVWITTTSLYTHVVAPELVRVHRASHPRAVRVRVRGGR